MTDPQSGPSDRDLARTVPRDTGARHIRVGIFVILGIVSFFTVLFLMTDPAGFRGRYNLVTELTDAGGVLFFRANDGVYGREIWALLDNSTCHLLTLNHVGQGANPVPDPTSSAGCDIGFFEAGEVVTLTATPDSSWFVGSWSGSDADGSTSAVNTVTMPGAKHTVTVNYDTYPIFTDGFESGDTSAWSRTIP